MASSDEEVRRGTVHMPKRFLDLESESDDSPPEKQNKTDKNVTPNSMEIYPAVSENFPLLSISGQCYLVT